MMPYIGPTDAFRRFMSGLPTEALHFCVDQSQWIVAPMTPWHNAQLTEILIAGEADDYRSKFNDIVSGVSL